MNKGMARHKDFCPYLLAGFLAGTALMQAQEPGRPTVPSAVRTIQFETTQVTQADVTVSFDNRWLIFTILGHLFRLPADGGTAEQLTFGPYYDSDPVFSPDGRRVAFVSDREDSDRNIFVLELTTGQITQVTREPWADRPVWSPDGLAIVYLSPVGEPRPFNGELTLLAAWVRRIRLGGGAPATLNTGRQLISSAFYLPDGRLAWTVMEPREPGSSRVDTRIEAANPGGTVSAMATFEAFPDRVIASPSGDGLYCRCYTSVDIPRPNGEAFRAGIPSTEHLLFLPLRQGAERPSVPLSRVVMLHNVWNHRAPFGFALTADGESLYIGDAGRVWKIATASGVRVPVPFTARVVLETRDSVVPRKPTFAAPGTSAPARVVSEPRLSPDGRSLVFGAAGSLWRQQLDGGAAKRLFEGDALERDPAFSPDGHQLAYVRTDGGPEQVQVFDFESRESRSVFTGDSVRLSWTPDGQRLVFAEDGDPTNRVVAVTVRDGKSETLVDDVPVGARPHLSGDGRLLFVADDGGLHRVGRSGPTSREPLTRLANGIRDALVSPDGRWLTFRRNAELWVAPIGAEPVQEKDTRRLSLEGAEGYALTPDGSSVIYAIGNHVWQQRLADGSRQEIPIRLELHRPTPPPLLLRRVRVLDYAAGGFGREVSVYIDQGRIRWMGSERGRNIPGDTITLDAGGRFAIPGLFDMHTHAGTVENTEVFIGYGVTSIRDVGNSTPGWFNAFADRVDSTAQPEPRPFYSGDTLHYVPESNVSSLAAVRDVDSARSHVRSREAQGAHFIKAYSSLSWRLRRAVADEALEQGLPVVGHGTSLEEITKSVILGFASVEHMDPTSRAYDDILLMLAAAGTRWTPTLELVDNDLLLRNEPERLDDPKLRALMPESAVRAAQTNGLASSSVLQGRWAGLLGSLEPAHRLGVRLLAGTDTVGGRILPGLSLHWELEHLVEAHLPPLEVLRIATERAAEAVGAQDDLGTLDPGKLADIVLLDKNPLEDIKNTQTIWRVLRDGWLFDPDRLH